MYVDWVNRVNSNCVNFLLLGTSSSRGWHLDLSGWGLHGHSTSVHMTLGICYRKPTYGWMVIALPFLLWSWCTWHHSTTPASPWHSYGNLTAWSMVCSPLCAHEPACQTLWWWGTGSSWQLWNLTPLWPLGIGNLEPCRPLILGLSGVGNYWRGTLSASEGMKCNPVLLRSCPLSCPSRAIVHMGMVAAPLLSAELDCNCLLSNG